jgi:hypothetical protein
MITAAHFISCLALKEELHKAGVEHDWNVGSNESLVHRARMEMTASFLKTSYAFMMWLDADIEFELEDVAKLWNMDADVAVGLYCMKRSDLPLSAWRNGRLVKIEECPSGPFEVDYAGTGFMLIKREVIEKLAAVHGTYEGQHGMVPALYMTPIHNGCLESEDYFFCRIAREAGFKVIADPTIKLGHYGLFRYGHTH